MEIESKIELDYLKKMSKSFWMGAKRDMESGVWLWESNKALLNFKLWTMTLDSYGNVGDGKAFNRDDSFVATTTDARCARLVDKWRSSCII